jgi:NAD(P)-dependent dehydrogenase (short-subunit alcohol dehydrogenase family)
MEKKEKYHGKSVLVTGSGTGIGRAVAIAFAQAGAKVAIHYNSGAEGAASAVEEISDAGGSARAFQANLASLEAVKKLARESLAWLGGVDVLVNNAGITMNRSIDEVTPEQFDTLYHVNVRAQIFLTQAILSSMEKRGHGAIINISSIHAFEGYQQHTVYAGTKGAIVAMTRALAIELAPRGIRVNCIAPGAVEVANYQKSIEDWNPEAAGNLIPAGFIGQPEDIAHAAVWLASDEARFVLGHTLVIDGGTTAWMPFSDGFKQPVTAQFGKGYVPGL